MRPQVSDSLRATLHGHFNRMDLDADGTISAHDVEQGLARLGVAVSHDEILDLIHTVDVNKTGTLEYGEFEDLWATHVIASEGVRTGLEVLVSCCWRMLSHARDTSVPWHLD